MRNLNSLEAIRAWVGTQLPTRYAEIVEEHGGKFLGGSVLLYAADDLVERNDTFETKVYCPGYLAIGDDSGGRAFMIATGSAAAQVFAVSHSSMSPEDFILLADDIDSWLIEARSTG